MHVPEASRCDKAAGTPPVEEEPLERKKKLLIPEKGRILSIKRRGERKKIGRRKRKFHDGLIPARAST